MPHRDPLQVEEETLQGVALTERGVDPTLAMCGVAKDVATAVVGVAPDLVVAPSEDAAAQQRAVAELLEQREFGARLAGNVPLVVQRPPCGPGASASAFRRAV